MIDGRARARYRGAVVIVWDEPKRQANLAKHGIDFAEVDEAFFTSAVIRAARGRRLGAFGMLAARPVAVIFQPLGAEGISIISARPANAKERRLFR